MCIAFIISGIKKQIKKIILFNRDQTIHRKSLPLHEWSNGIVAGLDINSEGTWFGFNKETKNFAFLTNLDAIKFKQITNLKFRRGQIIKQILQSKLMLTSKQEILNTLTDVVKYKDQFNGFNLVCGNLTTDQYCYFNQSDSSPLFSSNFFEEIVSKTPQEEKKSVVDKLKIFSVSNGHAFKEVWDKMEYGVKFLNEKLGQIGDDADVSIDKIIKDILLPVLLYYNKDEQKNKVADDSAYNDIFIRPYFEDERDSLFATISTTILIVTQDEIVMKELIYDYSSQLKNNDVLQQINQKISELDKHELEQEHQIKLNKLSELSKQYHNQFKMENVQSSQGVTLTFKY